MVFERIHRVLAPYTHSKIEENQYLDIDNGCFVDFKPGMGHLCALELGTHHLTFQKCLD